MLRTSTVYFEPDPVSLMGMKEQAVLVTGANSGAGISGRFFMRACERREVAARLWRISEQLCRIPAARLQ